MRDLSYCFNMRTDVAGYNAYDSIRTYYCYPIYISSKPKYCNFVSMYERVKEELE